MYVAHVSPRSVCGPSSLTLYAMTTCDARADINVTINGSPTIANAPDVDLCSNNIAGVVIGSAALPDVTYNWLPNNGTLSDVNIAMPTANPTDTTQYVVTATFPGGCTATDTVFVDVLTLTLGSDTAVDTTVCESTSINIGATPVAGYSYLWSPANNLDSDAICA